MILTFTDPAICEKPVKFELRFGFKCFIKLGRALGLNTFKEVAEKFSGFGKGEIDFDQLELIEKLVIAAAESYPLYIDTEYYITEFSIVDHLLENPAVLEQVIKEFVASFPLDQGKPQPQKAATKKTTTTRK